jgi:organic radical activating enzyme
MFGTNDIVGAKYFSHMAADTLMVTTVFVTLQGEGPYSGLPCVFLRLAKCNLNCSFCDTFFDNGEIYNFEAIIEIMRQRIRDYFNVRGGGEVPDWAHLERSAGRGMGLVITGGEPMLQANGLGAFLNAYRDYFKWTQIETNGIIPPTAIPKRTTIVCSPKCVGTPGHYTKLRATMLDRAYCLKFVMSADPASPYHTIPDWALAWARTRPVYISPMNIYNRLPQSALDLRMKRASGDYQADTIDKRSIADEVVSFWEPGLLDLPAIKANHEYAAKYVLDHGLRLSLQTHLFASLA